MLDITRAFLRDWLEWAESDAPRGAPFDPCFGLCSNAIGYGDSDNVWEVRDDLTLAFEALCPEDPYYPFGIEDYKLDMSLACHHTNPARLAWVRAQLQET
jgi:hypothetical protein